MMDSIGGNHSASFLKIISSGTQVALKPGKIATADLNPDSMSFVEIANGSQGFSPVICTTG